MDLCLSDTATKTIFSWTIPSLHHPSALSIQKHSSKFLGFQVRWIQVFGQFGLRKSVARAWDILLDDFIVTCCIGCEVGARLSQRVVTGVSNWGSVGKVD